MQLALGYMALGQHGRALAALRRTFKRENVLLNWLHLFPVFDPLRTHPVFQEHERERLEELTKATR
jgi:hypothetical protein